MLKRIDLRVYPHQADKKFYTGYVEELYANYLGKIDFGAVKYITVYFTNTEGVKDQSVTGYLDYDTCFDFVVFYNIADTFSKKVYILNALHQALLRLCEINNYQAQPFIEAYQKCLVANLNNSAFFKNKLFPSPNKSYYMGLYVHYDIALYQIFEILFDHNKVEIARRCGYQADVAVFRLKKAFWDDAGDVFYYQYHGPEKVFQINIADLSKGTPIPLPASSSQYFKK